MKMAIPIGVHNYQKLCVEKFYTVDKTLMIKDFLERKNEVTLITRPRRFGKTLNMSMMSEFFDITKESINSFKETKIEKTECYKEMNQYPVIFLSFANCKGEFKAMKKALFDTLRNEYARYQTMFENDESTKDSVVQVKKIYQSLCNGEDLVSVNTSLKVLCKYLYEKLNKRVMFFLDEYDTPFIEAHVQGYYNDIKDVLSALLHSALKDNEYLQYAMLTGIQRVAKESIFSDLNNLVVYTVKDIEYAQYFGFTTEETNALLEYYGLSLNDDVKTMYNGYRMGDIDIYNPWSIINYAATGKLISFWVNTSSNKVIKQFMKQSDESFKFGYETLIEQGYLDTQVKMDTSFYEENSTSNLWGLFVNAGYLTIIDSFSYNRSRICIPNQEVESEFINLTAHYLHVSDSTLLDMFAALSEKRFDDFLKFYRLILLDYPSYYDLKGENSYHMLLLGMSIIFRNKYSITSNREVGKGRNDIILKAKSNSATSFILELKYAKDENELKDLATQAIEQIKAQKYDHEVHGDVVYIGLAHCGKEVEMSSFDCTL